MTFDPMSVEVTCVTLPKDHCVQVPWQYINVCGYSDQFCKIPHTYTYIHTHTTYRMSDHIVSYWTQFRRDKKLMLYCVHHFHVYYMQVQLKGNRLYVLPRILSKILFWNVSNTKIVCHLSNWYDRGSHSKETFSFPNLQISVLWATY